MKEIRDYKKQLKAPIRTDRAELKDIIPLKQPLRILIDPSDVCNFRCKFCFQSYQKDFEGKIMSIELFEQIIKQLGEFEKPINIIHLYGLGEPLINKNVPYFVRRIFEEKVAKEVSITTNGSLLTQDIIDQLIEAGLTKITISLNGLKDEDFERIVGHKVEFERVYNQIKYFYEKKKKCHLHVKINGDDYSDEEKERFVELFKDYSDSINIDNVADVWSGIEIATGSNPKMYNESLDNDYNGEKIVCPQLFYEMTIHPDGSVSPCCADYKYTEQSLGNIQTESISEIWNSARWNRIRINALKGERTGYNLCDLCKYPECASTVNITPYRNEILQRMEKI